MINLNVLNEDQINVVTHDNGPSVVIASAGSGKTKTVVTRVAYLIDKGINPKRIWVGTFTTKAADEIKERVEEEFNIDAEDCNIGTLHSICLKILRNFYGKRAFAILNVVNDSEVWMFLQNYLRKNDHLTCSKDIKHLLQKINLSKLNLNEPIVTENLPINLGPEDSFAVLFRDYSLWLREHGKIDFSDMLSLAYKILCNNEDFKNSIIANIEYLMVDEAQDSNLVSYEIYKILGSKNNNIMFIGDPRQSIYGFQGSTYKYLNDFQQKHNAKLIELPLNYRSTRTIINHSDKLIQKDPMFQTSVSKTSKGDGENVQIIKSLDENDEAGFISEQIRVLINEGYNYKDIAILYRVNAQAITIIDFLTSLDIPFILHSKDTFFKKREIRQIVAYLKAFCSPDSVTEDDLKLMANAPLRYLKNNTIERGASYSRNKSALESLRDYIYNESNYSQRTALQSLLTDITEGQFKYNVNKSTTGELIQFILNNLKFQNYISESEDSVSMDDDKQLNVEVLFGASDKRPNPLEFITYAVSMADTTKKKVDTRKNGVNLMTIHSSKGLEFPVVFVAGYSTRLMPFYKASDSEDRRQERRLAYVASTRAKDRLIISTIEGKFGRFNVTPSPFIKDMELDIRTAKIKTKLTEIDKLNISLKNDAIGTNKLENFIELGTKENERREIISLG